MKIMPLEPVRTNELKATQSQQQKDVGAGFGEVLRSSIDSVSSRIDEANELSEGLAAGQHGNIHETMIAVEKAGISFRLMTKMQQKAITAYQEIMRIQV
jgi:flagellar hook-basal body complex protein FliE